MEIKVTDKVADLTEEERMEHQKEIAEVLLKMKPIQKEGEEK